MKTSETPSNQTCFGRHGAFTLMELLVVISIIVLLIAMLLPALSSARVAGQRVSSLTNVRQISMSLFTYTNDFHQSMPFQGALRTSSGGGYVYRFSTLWSHILVNQGYVPSMEVYWSPARMRFEGDWPHTNRGSSQLAHSYESVGYGLNRAVSPAHENDYVKNKLGVYANEGDFTLGQAHLNPLRMGDGQAPPPSRMMLLMETYSSQGSYGGPNGFYLAMAGRYDSQGAYAPFNYGGGVVRSYVDGHANASAGSRAVRVSGQQSHINNYPAWSPVAPDELGFSVGAGEGAYGGLWTFHSVTDSRSHMPWFLHWRTGWYPGMR